MKCSKRQGDKEWILFIFPKFNFYVRSLLSYKYSKWTADLLGNTMTLQMKKLTINFIASLQQVIWMLGPQLKTFSKVWSKTQEFITLHWCKIYGRLATVLYNSTVLVHWELQSMGVWLPRIFLTTLAPIFDINNCYKEKCEYMDSSFSPQPLQKLG